MVEPELVSMGSIVILSAVAQWAAWRFYFPSILLLLVFGFLAGPVTGIIHPDELFGHALFPFISLSVAILLFEGGLSLKFSQLKGVGKVVTNLLGIGLLVTFVLSALAAHYLLGLDWRLSFLLGSVLTVSGPTVVIPLLRHIRPSPHIGSILRWEGILVDSIGALAAILVFEFVTRSAGGGAGFAVLAIAKTLAFGTAIGLLGAVFLVLVLRRYWVPDFLHVAVAFMAVIAAFVASNSLQAESGLLAVTVMGIALINQRYVEIDHIVEFKENLRVLLIGALFIVLAARLDLAALAHADLRMVLFLTALVLLVRPAAVAVSAKGSSLSLKEKAFLAAMYPRGIVAAAVSSVFALRLAELGYPGAEVFAPIAFLAIVGTVAIYGMLSLPLARWLGVAKPDPQGVLFIGGEEWVRKIGAALSREGVAVRLVDEHWSHVSAARMEGLPTHYVRSLHEYVSDEIELGDMGHLVALTASDELNSLVVLHYVDVFGRKELYQLPMDAPPSSAGDIAGPAMGGRPLFGSGLTYGELTERFARGADVKVTKITEEHGFDQAIARYGEDAALPVCLIDQQGKVQFFTAYQPPKPRPGHRLMLIIPPDDV